MRSIASEIEKRHDESIGRLREWVKHPALAAEDRGMDEGCDLMMRLARDAGFQKATRVDTDGHPGVFATLDAGAATTVALYFMYDVKQADPAEWSSPPFDAAIVDKPGFGTVIVGRGAEQQRAAEDASDAAPPALHSAGPRPSMRRPPRSSRPRSTSLSGSPRVPPVTPRRSPRGPRPQSASLPCAGYAPRIPPTGPRWRSTPRPTRTVPNPGLSTIAASIG